MSRKRDCLFSELSEADFNKFSNWLVGRSSARRATPIDLADLDADLPVVTSTKFTLNDGTTLNGFCFLYEISGFTCFFNNRQVLVAQWEYVEADEAARVGRELDRTVEQVFPIKFECNTKLFGKNRSGDITLY